MHKFTKKLLSATLAISIIGGVGGTLSFAAEKPITTTINKVTVTFHGDATNSKGFTWYTSQDAKNSDVQVVKKMGAKKPNFDKGMTFKGTASISTNSQKEYVHKAVAAGLEPDTEYYFRVGDASLESWSEVGSFTTAPNKGSFTFIDVADTQAKTEEEAILSAETIEKAMETIPHAEFIVHNGDLVDDGVKEEQWDWLLGHAQESLLNTTFVPSAGNHEDENYAFIDHFNLEVPKNAATETGAYYSYDYSNAHFVVLNSNEDSDNYDNFSEEQVKWLTEDVKAAKAKGAKWVIVNIHKGPYTTSNHATDDDIMGPNGVRNQIAPLMAELDIDFVLQGHDHIYARTKPINSEGKTSETDKILVTKKGQTTEYAVNPDGTIYLIPATAGPKVYYKNQDALLGSAYYNLFEVADESHAAIYGPDPNKNDRPVRGQIQNFIGITVSKNKLTAVSYEIDQNKNNAKPYIIDQFGIIKK